VDGMPGGSFVGVAALFGDLLVAGTRQNKINSLAFAEPCLRIYLRFLVAWHSPSRPLAVGSGLVAAHESECRR
jgi:hypothetical protein